VAVSRRRTPCKIPPKTASFLAASELLFRFSAFLEKHPRHERIGISMAQWLGFDAKVSENRSRS
jgi:hypothetical protein